MPKLYVMSGLLGLAAFLAGCGKNSDENRQYAVSGTATFDGEPIDLGAISLIPSGGGTGESGGGRPSGGVITDGKYEIAEEKGPNAGPHRVEIRWLKKTGKQLRDPDTGDMYDERKEALPARYHTNSELTADVSEDKTVFAFDLKSK